jgi:mediator of RNA polymerase II transcription subunit 14
MNHSLGIPLSFVEFPKLPTGILKRHITDEADSRLAYYLRLPELEQAPPGFEPPSRPKLPPGYVDAPLVRVFNFLRESSSLNQYWTLISICRSRDDVLVLSTGNSMVSSRQHYSPSLVPSKLILQAQRMRALGWADHLTVQMTQNRKSMTVSYWM